MGTHASIAYYISSHGYGHGVRAINQRYPRVTVHIVSELPKPFLSSQIGLTGKPVRAASLDVGMVQLDSIRVNVDATLDKAGAGDGTALGRSSRRGRQKLAGS